MSMKKISKLFLVCAIVLAGLAPKNEAKAGMIVFTSAFVAMGMEDGRAYATVAAGVGPALALTGLAVLRYGSTSLGTFLFALDADGSMNQGALEEAFADRYPFLDNKAAISNLASAIKAKVPADFSADEKVEGAYLVTLSEKETRQCLELVDLDESQIQGIVKDLK